MNNLETDTIRLDASTIKQLFDDTNYRLKDVREKKLVKPVALTLLPQEIKMIENTKERKELLKTCGIPFGAMISPIAQAQHNEDGVSRVDFREGNGPIR